MRILPTKDKFRLNVDFKRQSRLERRNRHTTSSCCPVHDCEQIEQPSRSTEKAYLFQSCQKGIIDVREVLDLIVVDKSGDQNIFAGDLIFHWKFTGITSIRNVTTRQLSIYRECSQRDRNHIKFHQNYLLQAVTDLLWKVDGNIPSATVPSL